MEVKSILEDLTNGRNVFLSGSGGTGKTYMLNVIYANLKENYNVFKTASTGVAAENLRGTTLHSWAGVQLGNKTPEIYYLKIKSKPNIYKKWKKVDVLIIDEISMIGMKFFDMLDKLGRLLRGNSKPFGGITILICGDVCQLPPVNDEYFFKSSVYSELDFKIYTLKHPWRFQNDIEFFHLLARVRLGEFTNEDIEKLKERQDAYYKEIANKVYKIDEIEPSRLYSKKVDVNLINSSKLKAIKSEEFKYRAYDKLVKRNNVYIEIETYQSIISVSEEISLKVGAQVMLIANLDVASGLCNGSRGVVCECTEEYVIVKFKNGKKINILPYTWEIENDDAVFTRSQIPLILAWCITIHKSQSSSLDSVIIDLGPSLFCPNMGYVALSRCRELSGIYIINLIPENIRCSEEAKEFEKNL